MHIGFDISQTGSGKAGCGYFTHAMIQSMLAVAPQHWYALYPSFGDFYFDGEMPLVSPYGSKRVVYAPRHANREAAGVFWNQPGLEDALGRPDIIQSNNFWAPVQVRSSRLIYTFYDLGFMKNPDWTTERNRIGCFDGVFRSAVAADWVIAISRHSRQDYLRTFPHFPADRVRVVSPCSRFGDSSAPGIRPAALEQLGGGDFWLSVGTIEPRKNQRMLAKAYAQYLALGGRQMPLVLAGGKGWLMEDFQQYLAELGIADQVILTGYVSDDELIWLYRKCYASLYPSLFEGYGLPVLEGMQFGAATMCSNTTSMPEVAGDAAMLLSPHNTEAWSEKMIELAANETKRHRWSVAAQQRAQQFDWRNSATALLEIYEEAISSPKRADASGIRASVESSARVENLD